MKKNLLTAVVLGCSLVTTMGLAGCSSLSSGPISDEYVKVNKYEGLKVPVVEKTEVTDEMVESTIESNLSSNTTYEEVKRAAQDKDQVNIDYVGKIKGKKFDGGSAEGQDLVLGSNSFIGANGDYKGFEEQIVGHKAGEKFDIKVKFPDDYSSEDLKGKVATFTITLNKVEEPVVPELTDETVQTLSTTSKTVDEYKEEIKKQLEEQYDETYTNTLQQEVYTELLANVEVVGDLQSEIDETYDSQYQYYESYAQMYGTDLETLCSSYMGMTVDQFKEQLKTTAEKSITFEHACKVIADKKNLLSDAEFKEKATELAAQYGYTDSTEATDASSEASTGASEATTAAESSTAAESATTEAAAEATTEAQSAYDQFIAQYGEEDVRNYVTEQVVMDWLVDKCEQTDDATTATTASATSDSAEESTTEAAAETTTGAAEATTAAK